MRGVGCKTMTFESSSPDPAPRYIVALDADVQQALWRREPAAHALLDLVDGSPLFAAVHLPAVPHFGDSLLLAAALLPRLPNTALIAQIDVTRKHPLNVARSLASLSHLSGHRIGWDLRVVPDADVLRYNPWIANPGFSGGQIPVRRAFANLVIDLLQTWPQESLIGDRERGWYHVEGAIRPLAHVGYFDIHGPLNIPGPPHGAIPFLSFEVDAELRGHLQVGEPGRAHASAAGLTLSDVTAPSNAGLGRSSEARPLRYVRGAREREGLTRLLQDVDLRLPTGLAPDGGAIWQRLGVRPSVRPIA